MDFEKPDVVFLGTSAPDAAVNRLKASNTTYKRKRLDSGVDNWREIIILLRQPQVRCVVVKLTAMNYEALASPEYVDVADAMLEAISDKPHQVFVHESILTGEVMPPQQPPPQVEVHTFIDADGEEYTVEEPIDLDSREEYWYYIRSSYMTPPNEQVRAAVQGLLDAYGLSPIPYRTNAELDVLAGAFVEDSQRNLLFRIYIPGGQLFAAEADALMRMFRDWLTQVGRHSVRQDGYRTSAGQVFEFFGGGSISAVDLPAKVDEFSAFLSSCVDDPAAAVSSLSELGLPAAIGEKLVSRFAKEARRLQVDVRHAREERLMQLRHSFESEAVDLIDPAGAQMSIEQVTAWLSAQNDLGSILPPGVCSSAPIVVNIGQQIIGQVRNSAFQSVQGTAHYGPEAHQLLALIEALGGTQQSELTSAVHELEDPDARQEDRITARQRLKGFLIRAGKHAEGIGVDVLKKYIEQKLGF